MTPVYSKTLLNDVWNWQMDVVPGYITSLAVAEDQWTSLPVAEQTRIVGLFLDNHPDYRIPRPDLVQVVKDAREEVRKCLNAEVWLPE